MALIQQELQDLIHTNLCLLRERDNIIEFEQGMFKERNPPGFEKVGYALLMILDPELCKKSIPWPLLDTKSHSEFRTRFAAFIKILKTKYPEDDIPDVMPSTLQYPGGEKFLRLMYKLSTLTLKVELKRMIGSEQVKMLLPRMVPSKVDKDNLVNYNIIHGACIAEQISGKKLLDYVAEATPVLETLQEKEKKMELDIKRVRSELEEEVSHLNVDKQMKQRLQDSDDSEAMAEWNASSEQKQEELFSRVRRLCAHRDHIVLSSEQLKSAASSKHQERVCLDGRKLGFTAELDKLAGTIVTSSDGRVRLQALLKAGLVGVQSLRSEAPPPDQQDTPTPLLPQAQALLVDSITNEKKCVEYFHILDTLTAECRTDISRLRPIVYARMRLKKAPDYFKYLKERQTHQHLLDNLLNKKLPTARKRRSSFLRNVLTVKSTRSGTFLCSFKRREPAAHHMVTPMCGRLQVPSFTSSRVPSTMVRGMVASRQNHMWAQVQATPSLREMTEPDETPAAFITRPCGLRHAPATDVTERSSLGHTSGRAVTGPSGFRRSLFKILPTGPRTKMPSTMVTGLDTNRQVQVTSSVRGTEPNETPSAIIDRPSGLKMIRPRRSVAPATDITKRSGLGHASATAATEPRGCRQSLSKKLLTGPRTKGDKNVASFANVPLESDIDVTPPVDCVPAESRKSPPRSKRRSVDEIIQRYNRLKESMAKKPVE